MYSQFQLLHLDIKPQNLFLVNTHVKVADFGLTKNLDHSAASITGGVTPVYAAPETFDGEGRRTTDQYSLAIVYQEMLTGQRPFTGTTARQLVLQHLQAEPDLASLPTIDQPIVRKALSKDYRDRFANCLEFVQALEIAELEKPPSKVSVTMPPPLPSPGGPTNGFVTHSENGAGASAFGQSSFSSEPGIQRPSSRPTSQLFEQLATSDPDAIPPSAFDSVADSSADAFLLPKTGPSTRIEDLRLVLDSGRRPTHHSQPATVVPPNRPATPRPTGDGVLLPALVIGIGFLGQAALKQLRRQIQDNFGSIDQVPQVRTLYLDSDPETLALATRGGSVALHSQEMLAIKLHRASHYIKPKEGTTAVDTWLPSRMLYRIPRQQVPAGIRALGRLAFVDNYETILRRLELEIEACTSPEALSVAHARTDMGLISTAPRVYVVTSLAGGTGSGMFIDVGYAVRALLQKKGVKNPDVVGVFLLPQASGKAGQAAPLANTFAALTELQHFSRPQTVFSATYSSKDSRPSSGKFSAKEAPFQRCLLVSTGCEQSSTKDDAEVGLISCPGIGQTANQLFMELFTRLGREVDRERTKWAEIQPKVQGQTANRVVFQTADLVRFQWPYKYIIHRTSVRLCQGLVAHWMSKDARPMREAVKQWAQQQWAGLDLNANQLIDRLQDLCRESMGQETAAAISQTIEPLTSILNSVANQKGSKVGRDNEGIVPLARVVEVLENFEQLLGTPDGCNGLGNKPPSAVAPGKITEVLKVAVSTLTSQAEVRIAELVVRLIEQPEFRLAGAEETLRQFSEFVQRALENQEELTRELQERSVTLYNQIHGLIENPEKKSEKESSWLSSLSRRSASRQSQYARELADVIRSYPKYRFQHLILQHVNSFFVSLRGLLSDQLREVDFCRARLKELNGKLDEEKEKVEAAARFLERGPNGPCRLLLPEGCAATENVVEMILARVGPAEMVLLDQQIQQMVRKQFRALVHICMASSTLLRSLVPQMLRETETFLQSRVQSADAVQMYLNKFRQGTEAGIELNEPAVAQSLLAAYDDAQPKLLGTTDEDSLCVLAVPDSPESEELQRLARQGLPRTRVQFAPSVDEIVLYREQLHTSLASLKQLTRTARSAYEQLATKDNLSPHSRLDITNWAPLHF
jgi:hypothetical protein